MGYLRHRAPRRGVCKPLQPARSPALSKGLGGPGLDQGAPQRGHETQEAISGAMFDHQSTIFGPPRLFAELDKPRIQQS